MSERLDSMLGGAKGVRLDTAKAIGERLLMHDSLKNNIRMHQDVLEILVYTAWQQGDTTAWLQRSHQLVDVCRQQGAETEALRTEAELGGALCIQGQQAQGMARLDSVIGALGSLDPFRFNKEEFKHVLWSDADYHNGSGAMTASFDIYTAHVYEGEPGAGDYYAVRMTASLASAGMWKGKGDNTHGGVHVRWCGAYATDFIAEAHLREHNADWNQDLSDRIMFPSGGFPSPSTTVGKTTYTDTNSFSLNMSQTVGASKKSGTDGSSAKTEAGIEGSVSFSEGWTWQHSESRSISDVDVANETKNGYWARWHLTFNNLPEFKFSEQYGFDIKNNIASRSTMDLHASWLWYDKSGKDNQDRTPYDLCVYMKATYGHQNWTSTEADLYKKSWQWNSHEELIIPLEKVVNVTAGHLMLKNDLPEGMNISNVKVLNADDNTEVSEFENTIPNGGELLLGTYNSNLRYLVTFKARKSGADTPRTYKYTTNPSIKLNHKAKTTLYANGDFTEQ